MKELLAGKTVYLRGHLPREDQVRRRIQKIGYKLHVRKAGPPDFDHWGTILWTEQNDAAI